MHRLARFPPVVGAVATATLCLRNVPPPDAFFHRPAHDQGGVMRVAAEPQCPTGAPPVGPTRRISNRANGTSAAATTAQVIEDVDVGHAARPGS